ncbi:hypothetical protein ACE1CM_07350 [Microseira sp. BLCC-F43]
MVVENLLQRFSTCPVPRLPQGTLWDRARVGVQRHPACPCN